jgi:SAM-dependent methyltransferase
MPNLFDMELRAARRDRAARLGPELFLYERAFEDCLDRLSLVQRRFERALLIGCPDRGWPARLQAFANNVDVRDPGPVFAQAAHGEAVIEDSWEPVPATFDLVLAIGALDTINDLPRALIAFRLAMKPGGLFLGALSGGDTLPQLRAVMRDPDVVAGPASPHVHPRIEASALAPLLTRCGFSDPVVDVDRVQVRYASFAQLVGDLRRMGATNLLTQRSKRPLSRASFQAASAVFDRAGDGERTTETFEILHFACWNPATA